MGALYSEDGKSMFDRIVASDEAVKAIFDHFRNVGIAGAIAAVATWTFKHPASGALAYMSYVSAASLGFLAMFLLILNERHGHRKLEAAKVPLYWEFAARLVYGFALIALFSGAAARSS